MSVHCDIGGGKWREGLNELEIPSAIKYTL